MKGATLRKHQEFLLQAHLISDKEYALQFGSADSCGSDSPICFLRVVLPCDQHALVPQGQVRHSHDWQQGPAHGNVLTLLCSPCSHMLPLLLQMVCPKCRFKFCFNCKTDEWHTGSTFAWRTLCDAHGSLARVCCWSSPPGSCEAYQRWKKENAGAEDAFTQWMKVRPAAASTRLTRVGSEPSSV